jgi:hypothetical protein
MKFELNESETKNLLRMVCCAGSMVEHMSDHIDDPQIATRARIWGKLTEKLLLTVREQGLTDIIDDEDGFRSIKWSEFESLMELQNDFGDLHTHNELSRALARRDFWADHTQEEIETLTQKNNGYLGVELHPYEEKYWKEFEEYEYSRLFIHEP